MDDGRHATGGPTDVGGPRARLLAGLPVIERRLSLAGISTSVLDGGAGPRIVLLHGPGEFAGKWRRVIPDLARTHRVIAPDLPGHGASPLPDGRLDAPEMLAWLGELIKRTCPSPPVLVGHVLGGAIAARFAIERSDRLERLVLVDSLGLAAFRPRPRFALAMLGFLARPTPGTYGRFMRQCSFDLDDLQRQMGEDWEPYAAYSLELARGAGAKAAGRVMRRCGLPRIPAAELARITVPTTLIWGRHDRAIPLRVADAASARYGWPLHVVEGCADDPPRDRPEAFLEALRAALDSPRAPERSETCTTRSS
jgi:pimeloyl-ACP methyl ester carboxylesterase